MSDTDLFWAGIRGQGLSRPSIRPRGMNGGESATADDKAELPSEAGTSARIARRPEELVADLLFEHAYLARILNAFEDYLVALRNRKAVDYEIMHEIMHYIVHYPDMYHHPREHLLFERLVAHDPLLRSSVHSLEREHDMGYAEGHRLLELLVAARKSPIPALAAEIQAKGERYIEQMRRHMQQEESGILARAASLLTTTDCEAINAQLQAPPDPLIEAGESSPYPTLVGRLEETVKSVYTDTSLFEFVQGLVVIDAMTELWVGAHRMLDIAKSNVRETYASNSDYCKTALHTRSPLKLWHIANHALADNWQRQQRVFMDVVRTCRDTTHNVVEPFKGGRLELADKK